MIRLMLFHLRTAPAFVYIYPLCLFSLLAWSVANPGDVSILQTPSTNILAIVFSVASGVSFLVSDTSSSRNMPRFGRCEEFLLTRPCDKLTSYTAFMLPYFFLMLGPLALSLVILLGRSEPSGPLILSALWSLSLTMLIAAAVQMFALANWRQRTKLVVFFGVLGVVAASSFFAIQYKVLSAIGDTVFREFTQHWGSYAAITLAIFSAVQVWAFRAVRWVSVE